MSRSRYWEYTLTGPDAQANWDRFFDNCNQFGVPVKYCPTGGGNLTTGEWDIMLYATRAKARRIADTLRAQGLPGALTEYGEGSE